MYKDFLLRYKPDVVHLHTFMGLHKEFLEAAQELGIRTVFSVHDFFTICPKVTLFRKGEICSCNENFFGCPECNMTALSEKKIFALQTPLYRVLKDSGLVKKLRKGHRDKYLRGDAEVSITKRCPNAPDDYRILRNYYEEMVNLISMIHYNSSITKEVFERTFHPEKSQIIPITHLNILDNRSKKVFTERLRFSYLGAQSGAKGYFLLKKVLDELWDEGYRFNLNLYFTPKEMAPYMRVHGRYSYNELESVMGETDLLVCPSVWYETFGYTVLEALSFGVPVLVSETVGAKDIIPPNCGGTFGDYTDLKNIIRGITLEKIQGWHRNILKANIPFDTKEMIEKIKTICYGESYDIY